MSATWAACCWQKEAFKTSNLTSMFGESPQLVLCRCQNIDLMDYVSVTKVTVGLGYGVCPYLQTALPFIRVLRMPCDNNIFAVSSVQNLRAKRVMSAFL
jgi:hypothetical protein